MQILVLKNNLKGQTLGTDTDKLFSFLVFGDSPVRVHPLCHLYLLSYCCPLREVPLKPLLIFLIPLEESDSDLPEELQEKGVESVLNIPRFTDCCIHHEANLDCFDEGHPTNSPK